MPDPKLQSTAELLVLRTLSPERTYVSTIAQRIVAATGGALNIQQVPMVALLVRLAQAGLVEMEEGLVPSCRLTSSRQQYLQLGSRPPKVPAAR